MCGYADVQIMKHFRHNVMSRRVIAKFSHPSLRATAWQSSIEKSAISVSKIATSLRSSQ